jgi:hypothetical protein
MCNIFKYATVFSVSLQTWQKYYFESILINILNAVLKSYYIINIYSFCSQHNIPETLIQTHDTNWFALLDYKLDNLNIATTSWRL